MILVLCVVALAISIPLSRLVAAAFYSQIATLLNLEITDNSIPLWVPLIQISSGIVIPFIAAAVPVILLRQYLSFEVVAYRCAKHWITMVLKTRIKLVRGLVY